MVQLETALAALARFYGLLPTPPRDPFILFVWEVLSPHTTPAKRDAALAALKRIRVAADMQARGDPWANSE